jgi:hypothetical protein
MLSGELKTSDQFQQSWKDNPAKLGKVAKNPGRKIFNNAKQTGRFYLKTWRFEFDENTAI